MPSTKWPKQFPPLSEEQSRISDDFMKHWHDVLPNKFGIVDRYNHSYPVKNAPEGFVRTLEIGAGLGEHMMYEQLTAEQRQNYVAMDIRENMVQRLQERFPDVLAFQGDCQSRLDFPDGHFDRILAIHVLEHLPNLPAALRELHRLCDKSRGVFSIVIPCEGSFAYGLARRISAQRIFEARYRQSYRWFIEREHVNRPPEILEELHPYFTVVHQSFFPLAVPLLFCNLCIGLTLAPNL